MRNPKSAQNSDACLGMPRTALCRLVILYCLCRQHGAAAYQTSRQGPPTARGTHVVKTCLARL